jgi:hypothetical protein
MGKVRMVNLKTMVTIDPNIERGVSYAGLLELDQVKAKLQGNFSLAKASAFPLYLWFLQPVEHKVIWYGYYYEPPGNICARKAASLDRSLGNLFLSNLPGWTVLPDKETSVTVYSSRNTANGYSKKPGNEGNYPGKMYRAVPELNARLVIAPTADIRYSFHYARQAFGITHWDYGSPEKFGGYFHGLFHAFYELFHVCGIGDSFPSDWQFFITALKDIAFEKTRPARKLSADTETVHRILMENKTDLPDFLDKVFSPLHNGFKVIDYKEEIKREAYPDNQIWMASPCLFIEEGLFEEMSDMIL